MQRGDDQELHDQRNGMERRHVWVRGRVQGVFFRQSCATEATRRSVCGWVRNLPDGRVEAVFEGSAIAVEAMVQWCRSGPPHARVKGIEVRSEPVEGHTSFGVTG